MKCDELKAYNVVATADVNPEVVDSLGCTEWTGYDKNEVDAAIAELKDENRRLKRTLWHSRAKAYRYIAELLTCFNPDYVRNRKMFTPNNLQQKQMNSLEWAHLMLKVESKCLKKVEEYK